MDLPLTLEDARKQAGAGRRFKYVFFWGHQPTKDGSVGPSALSQWYAAPFVVDGIRYPTAEHFMMAEKARLFHDDARLDEILRAPHPSAAKQAGRSVRGFVESVWVENRFDIVVRASHAKFSQSPELREYLLSTKKRVLVEASPVDRIWGIGLAVDDPHVENPHKWRGLNLLGFALMKVRGHHLA